MTQKATQIPQNLQTITFSLDSALEPEKTSKEAFKNIPRSPRLHQEILLNNTRRRRPFGLECQLEMTDDPVDCLGFLDKRYDVHPAFTGWTDQWVHLVDLADHLCPAFGRHISWLSFNDGGIKRTSPGLSHLAPMGIGVESVVADHDLTLVRNMGGDSGDELQIIHRLHLRAMS